MYLHKRRTPFLFACLLVFISSRNDEVTLDGINQFYVNVETEGQKLQALLDLYDSTTIPQSFIFCNMMKQGKHLTAKLQEHKMTVSAIVCLASLLLSLSFFSPYIYSFSLFLFCNLLCFL
jgi:superfamily II DNA/RNA helicase